MAAIKPDEVIAAMPGHCHDAKSFVCLAVQTLRLQSSLLGRFPTQACASLGFRILAGLEFRFLGTGFDCAPWSSGCTSICTAARQFLRAW
jgi:hypothetical protein